MNNWDFNEVTQQDILDYKACKHNETGKIYGIKDSSSCQSGKEISREDIEKLTKRANAGDEKALKLVKQIREASKEANTANAKEKKEKEAAERKKKQAEEEAKGKKGKGGKGKKGGGKGKGKGKGGKGGKGGGGAAKPAAKAQTQADTRKQQQQAKKEAVARARDQVAKLQKMMREVKDPKARQQIQQAIGDLMKSVVDATKADLGVSGENASAAGQIQGKVQGEAAKNEKE